MKRNRHFKASAAVAITVLVLQLVFVGGSILNTQAQTADTSADAVVSAPADSSPAAPSDSTTLTVSTDSSTSDRSADPTSQVAPADTSQPTTSETSVTSDTSTTVADDTATVTYQSTQTDTPAPAPVPEPLVVSEVEPVLTPQLSTDKEDYHPGETATIFGKFFQALQDIVLKIFGGSTDDGTYTESTQNVTTDSVGAFTTAYTLDNIYRPLYTVVANSTDDTQLARTTFTDAALSLNLDQCQNDTLASMATPCGTAPTSWANGDINGNNSQYREGDGLPYRFAIEKLGSGTWNIRLQYDFTQGGKFALDRLTQFDLTQNSNPCQGVSGCTKTSPVGTITIPGEVAIVTPTAPALPNGGDLDVAGTASNLNTFFDGKTLTVWNYGTGLVATGAADAFVTQTGLSTGNSSREFKFQIITSGCPAAGCKVMIGWTGHISSSATGANGGWGAGNGASFITGAPFHMRVLGVDATNGTTGGNQDRSVQLSAIVNPSTITIHKVTSPNSSDPTVFTFTTTGTGYTGFTLTGGNQNQQSITGTGSYSVLETVPAGWGNTGLTCSASGTGSSATPNLGAHSVAITIGSGGGATIDCIYTNTLQQGTIELKKVWSGTGGQTTLNIGTSVGGTQVDTQLTGAAGAAPLTTGQNTVSPGTYYMSETGGLTNYTTAALVCFNDVNNNGANDDASPVTVGASDSVAVASNQHVICTYTNTRNQGKIELQKDFVGTPENVTIKIGTTQNGTQVDSDVLSADGTDGEHTVDTGTYFVSETLTTPANYTSGLACSNDVNHNNIVDGGDTAHTVNTSTGEVAVGNNDDVICVYTNTRNQGTIELKKVWSGTGGQTTLQIGTSNGGTQVDTQLTGAAGAAPLTTGQNTVNTGTYFNSETGGLTDYTTGALVCFNDANNNGINDSEAAVTVGANDSVAVAAGQHVICTYTNTRNQGTIELKKHWVGTPGSTSLTIGSTIGGNEVDTQAVSGSDGTTGQNTVNTGTYYGNETGGLTNYDQSALSCYNDANNNGVNDSEAAVTVGASNAVTVTTGQHVICTLTNTRQQGKIELQKDFVGTSENVTIKIGTTQNASDIDSDVLSADGTDGEHTVDTGGYFVSEVLTTPAKYASILACFNDVNHNNTVDGGDTAHTVNTGTGAVSVGTNDDVICVYTNNKPEAQIDVDPLSAFNKVGDKHVITATVKVHNGDGIYGDAADGTLVTFSLTNNTALASFVGGNTCTTTAGFCSVTINATVTGGVDIHASSDPVELGVTIHVETDGVGDNSANAHKTYENARITITPATSTNEVGSPHTFVVEVDQDTGSGFVPVPAGTLANAIASPAPTSLDVSDCNDGVDASGQCNVIITSSVAGVFTITARSTVVVNGVTFKLQTNGIGSNSGPATKTYVDASLALSPQQAENDVNDPHTITVHVTKNDGSGVTDAVGVTVVFSITSGTADFVGGNNDCVTNGSGQCSVSIVDDAPGANTIDATTTFLIGGVSVTRQTNGGNAGPDGTDSAEKTYIAGKIIVKKVTVGGDASFNFNADYSSDFQLSDGQQNDSGYIPTGNHAVDEDVPPGWDLSDITCVSSLGGSENNTAIDLTNGETVTCTFTNTKRGDITIVKDAQPNDLIDFSFSGGLGSFLLDDDQGVFGENNTLFNSKTFSNKTPGSYTVIETLPNSFWKFEGATCVNTVGGTPYTNVSNVANGITITLDPGADVTCTFVNHKESPTRTLGFWQTHTSYTSGVFAAAPLNGSMLIGNGTTHKGPVDTINKIFGAFYSSIPKTTTGANRTPLDKARMQLLQQLVAAKLNCANFGCTASVLATISAADGYYATGTIAQILASASALDLFNNSGDTITIGPAGSATPKTSQSLADKVFWNTP